MLVHLADQRRSRTDSHGIINFSLGLVHALPGAMGPDERLVVLANDEIASELADLELRAGDELRLVPAPASTLARLRLDHVGVLREAAAVGAAVVLYPKGFLPLRPRAGRRVRQVPCLHDDIPARALRDRSLPWRRRARAAYFTALLRWSLRAAHQRLFVSAFTAGQLAPLGGGARPTDAVVHEGITLPRLPLVPLADRAPQALVLGSSHPHKRTQAGLDLLGADAALGDALERVVVLGPLDPPRERAGRLPIEHRPHPVSGDELAALIARSRVLVYPSEYEGFGLPPIEAFALGTPAVFRRTDAAREVLPGVPGGYDQEQADDVARAATEVLGLDDAALDRLSQEMWRRFDWPTVAASVVAALRAGQA